MLSFYDPYIEKENEYYRTLQISQPSDFQLSPKELDDALNWLIAGSHKIVDFGCGSGVLSFLCALRGVGHVTGIDLAEEGIRIAQQSTKYVAKCQFFLGSMEELEKMPECSVDGIILSNILDNMRPKDALSALRASIRILKPGGKALIKLNPYLTQEKIEEWNIQVIEEDLLDDGLLLWNKEDAFWRDLLNSSFASVEFTDLYYKEFDKHERLFMCKK